MLRLGKLVLVSDVDVGDVELDVAQYLHLEALGECVLVAGFSALAAREASALSALLFLELNEQAEFLELFVALLPLLGRRVVRDAGGRRDENCETVY